MFSRKLTMSVMLVILVLGFGVTAAQDTPTEFRFASLQDPAIERVNQMLIAQFNELHPDIPVQVEYLVGDYSTTLAAQAAAGTLPDVTFTADLFVVPWAQAGISVDMQPLAEADPDFDLSDVYENMLALSQVEGEGLYMIPSSYDVVTMYYNKNLFEEAGAPLPTAESTWDDIIASCIMIREATGKYCLPSGSATDPGGTATWWALYVPFIEGYGGQILSDDRTTVMLSSPETLAGLQAYTDMWTVHDIGQPFDFDTGGECFMVGECALWLHIPGLMNAVRSLDPQPFEWDVEVIPTLPEGKFTGMGTYGFTVTANAQDPQLAWDFIKGLLSPETQEAITLAYAGMPLLRSLREDPDIVNLPGPPDNIEAFIANGDNGITPTYFPGECGSLYAGQINTEIEDAFEAVIIGGASVEEAFTVANDNIQSCLDG